MPDTCRRPLNACPTGSPARQPRRAAPTAAAGGRPPQALACPVPTCACPLSLRPLTPSSGCTAAAWPPLASARQSHASWPAAIIRSAAAACALKISTTTKSACRCRCERSAAAPGARRQLLPPRPAHTVQQPHAIFCLFIDVFLFRFRPICLIHPSIYAPHAQQPVGLPLAGPCNSKCVSIYMQLQQLSSAHTGACCTSAPDVQECLQRRNQAGRPPPLLGQPGSVAVARVGYTPPLRLRLRLRWGIAR